MPQVFAYADHNWEVNSVMPWKIKYRTLASLSYTTKENTYLKLNVDNENINQI